MSFGVIVNRISSDKVEDMYKELAKDNFRSMFDGLSIPGFTFDINIDSVIMLSFHELGLKQNKFQDTFTEEILRHPAAAIRLTFESGVSCREGYTKKVLEEDVQLNGHNVVLIDVPGLYEPKDNETRLNAKKLTEALSNKNYDYKLYFVTLATNRGPLNPDLVMMSKVNQCIKKVGGSHVSFRVIVNQIMAAPVYEMYKKEMASDNFKSFFQSLDKAKEIGLRGFSFKISIDSVMLLMFNESDVETHGFRDKIVADVCAHSQSAIEMKELKASNEDITLFESAVMVSWLGVPVAVAGRVATVFLGGGMVATVAVNAGLAISAVGGTVWLLHQAYRLMNETNQTSVMEELATEGSATEGPTTEGPATEGSATEESAAERSAREEPATEGSVAEGSATEGSATEGSAAERSATEGPATEGSVAEESATEGLATEGSATEGSVTEGSVTEGIATEGSATEGSVTEGSGTEGSATEGSTMKGSAIEGSVTEDRPQKVRPREDRPQKVQPQEYRPQKVQLREDISADRTYFF
ncbi:hypothetical protein BGZ52_009092 [Haplosporangium bisporale]|nr:hypothetical protein BGZ52_009092 [Haplosporangium bisporale]